MAVCQFFLQGRCRFGQNCRLEHTYGGNDDRDNRNPTSSQQLSNIVRQIVGVVILAEKGGQWPLSCFSPVKEGPNIPGWEDVSPEEVRWKMYEARSNGTLNQCINEINQLYSEAEKRRNILKQPTVEVINMIVNVLKGKKDTQNPFTSSTASTNIFGGASQSTGTQNIFGNTSQPSGSIFGGSSPPSSAPQGNIFGGAVTQGNIFGGSSTNFSNQNIFGGSASPGGFSQNVFSNQAASSQSIFSSSPVGSGNVFSSSPVQNLFSNSQVTPVSQGVSTNVFSSGNNSGIFSSQTPNTGNIFGAQSALYPNTNNKTANAFGTGQTGNVFKSQNAFGGQEQTSKNLFGGQTPGSNQQRPNASDSSVYSKVEDLSEEDIKSFTAATFSFGKIPLKPPPQEYCK